MSSLGFFGILGVDDQKYALPLNDILGIESTVNTKLDNGNNILIYQNQEIDLYELNPLKNNKNLIRKLSILLNGEDKRAIQVDSFITKQINTDKIKSLPEPMVNDESVIKQLIIDEETDEIFLMLSRVSLINYLDNM